MSASAASDPLRILRAAEQRPVPWKNGGGLTRELAVHPPGSDLDQFDWRVSIAQVRAAGPFSHFAGVQRHLAVLEGSLALSVGGGPTLRLAADDAALEFPGEAPVFAEPLGAAVTDLNVMTRRGRFECRLQRHSLGEPLTLAPSPGTRLVVALADLAVRSVSAPAQLGRLDALLVAREFRCELLPPAAFYLIELFAPP